MLFVQLFLHILRFVIFSQNLVDAAGNRGWTYTQVGCSFLQPFSYSSGATFLQKGEKSLGRSPPQQLETPRSGLYLLAFIHWQFKVRSFFLRWFPNAAVLRAVAVRSVEAAASGRRCCCMVTEAAALHAAYQSFWPRQKYSATYGKCSLLLQFWGHSQSGVWSRVFHCNGTNTLDLGMASNLAGITGQFWYRKVLMYFSLLYNHGSFWYTQT